MVGKGQPAQEKLEVFWRWCGLKCVEGASRYGTYTHWVDTNYHDQIVSYTSEPLPLDLNNLFKYAVPRMWLCEIKLEELIFWVVKVAHPVLGCGSEVDEDPALALFWALWQVKEATDGAKR